MRAAAPHNFHACIDFTCDRERDPDHTPFCAEHGAAWAPRAAAARARLERSHR